MNAGMSTRALRQIARWLSKRPSESVVVVLVYHRVAKARSDPWSLAVTPEHFAEHLEALRQHAVPLRLQQLSRAPQSAPGSRPKTRGPSVPWQLDGRPGTTTTLSDEHLLSHRAHGVAPLLVVPGLVRLAPGFTALTVTMTS